MHIFNAYILAWYLQKKIQNNLKYNFKKLLQSFNLSSLPKNPMDFLLF